MSDWMIYGANGYTGRLAAEEALRRGHSPIVAGRSAEKILPLAEELGLEPRVFALDDEVQVAEQIADVDLVFHAAGPYAMTARPMVHACLRAQTHYLDITGEIPVFEHTFKHGRAAERLGILLCSGMGFDVIPSDCLIAYVADQVAEPVTLEVGIRAIGQASAGTTKSMLEIIAGGGLVRRDGELTRYRLGKGARWLRFPDGRKATVPIPWGDLSTAYRTTGIPNITTYYAYPPRMIRMMQLAPLAVPLMRITPLRRLMQRTIENTVEGPSQKHRETARTAIWARVENAAGDSAQAWLETLEGYQFTAVAGVRAVETVLEDPPAGALSPAQVLGADWVLDIEGTRRYDTLPERDA